jgi:hypothetical protein
LKGESDDFCPKAASDQFTAQRLDVPLCATLREGNLCRGNEDMAWRHRTS